MGLSRSPSPLIPLPSRERGNMVGLDLLSSRPPHLWIADQVRNDVTVLVVLACCCPARPALWIPAYAGMTVRDAGNDGLWLFCCCPARPDTCGYCLEASMTGRGKCGAEILDSSLYSE